MATKEHKYEIGQTVKIMPSGNKAKICSVQFAEVYIEPMYEALDIGPYTDGRAWRGMERYIESWVEETS